MKIWKKVVVGTVLALLINGMAGIAWAATENGITVTYQRDMPRGHAGAEYTFFTAYNPGTDTQIFNGAGGTAITSGSVSTRQYNVSKVFQINAPTLASTTVEVDIYGQAGTDALWGLLSTTSISSADLGEGVIVYITQNVDNIRIGLQATGTESTDAITVTATMMGGR